MAVRCQANNLQENMATLEFGIYVAFWFEVLKRTDLANPRLRHKGRDILHFSFSESNTKFQVSNATLSVYIKGADRRTPQTVVLEVFKITDHSDPAAFHMVYAKKFLQPDGKGDWVKIDFTETVSEWFKDPDGNHGFIVNATLNGKKALVTDATADKVKRVSS
ncbi:unnamed protein product [Diabrotica balteata]|uniref:TGF-beta propeptide domain-containing protein n=1 Tax=Diabrotica balteata TaxID=107213 RepID=A0A9N9T0T3_DIABA|nr:unnamed protein product [Diabrotica balteata]